MKYLEKICYFFLFARILLHMCPNEKYEKYFGVLVEWIAIGMVALPILSGEAYEKSVQSWQKEWNLSMGASFENTIQQLDRDTEQIVQKSVDEEIEKQKREAAE